MYHIKILIDLPLVTVISIQIVHLMKRNSPKVFEDLDECFSLGWVFSGN